MGTKNIGSKVTSFSKRQHRKALQFHSPEHAIDPRKLAAIDIATLGPTFIISNFAGTSLLCLSVGIFILWHADSCQKVTAGSYFVSLGLNYTFMLFYALEIKTEEKARARIGDELINNRGAMAEYRRQLVYLLLPLVVPIAALRRHYNSARNR